MLRITRALLAAGIAAVALDAAAEPPEYVVFPASCGDVLFPHRVHHGISRACSGCHVQGKKAGLHGDPALATASLKDRGHALCITCHRSVRQASATVKCMGCHRREPPPPGARFAGRADQPAPQPAAAPPASTVARTAE